MPLFGRKRGWSPPDPVCSFVVACDGDLLPAPSQLVDREGRDGLPHALIAPNDAEPLALGTAYSVLTPARGAWRVTPRVADLAIRPERDAWEFVGLDQAAGMRLDVANVDVLVERGPGEGPLAEDILFGTRLADRIAELAEGVVLDVHAIRAWAPGGWRLPEPVGVVDVREHVNLHAVAEDDGFWVHTHGLLKFGRPDLELLHVPEELVDGAAEWLNAIGQYVIEGALIEPGHTIGDPDRPVRAHAGGTDREHWDGLVVLELADDGARHGAEVGLRDWLRSAGDR